MTVREQQSRKARRRWVVEVVEYRTTGDAVQYGPYLRAEALALQARVWRQLEAEPDYEEGDYGVNAWPLETWNEEEA